MATRHHKKGKGGTRIQKGCSKTYKKGKRASSNKVRRSSIKRRHQNGGNGLMSGSPWTPSAITAESNVNSQGVAPATSPNHFVFTPAGVSPSFIVPQNSNAIVEAQQTGGGKRRRSHVKTPRKKAIMVVPGQCGGASGIALLPFDISATIRDGVYSISNALNVMNGSPSPTTNPSPTIQPLANTSPLII